MLWSKNSVLIQLNCFDAELYWLDCKKTSQKIVFCKKSNFKKVLIMLIGQVSTKVCIYHKFCLIIITGTRSNYIRVLEPPEKITQKHRGVLLFSSGGYHIYRTDGDDTKGRRLHIASLIRVKGFERRCLLKNKETASKFTDSRSVKHA